MVHLWDAIVEVTQGVGGKHGAFMHLGTGESGAIARKAWTSDMRLAWPRNVRGMAEGLSSFGGRLPKCCETLAHSWNVHRPSQMKSRSWSLDPSRYSLRLEWQSLGRPLVEELSSRFTSLLRVEEGSRLRFRVQLERVREVEKSA